ncbi:hypothetical protein C8F04DRAFT_1230436 [Mycena alexandri]|uniref:Uncharacterized protein n=1 Tax=Mycena alexandri TaxID=1745969 RepID=A0AAD6X998_9AGAR|nr:hypothetical protein C8F04DRAFT_1230436 [Mycena alexandri]
MFSPQDGPSFKPALKMASIHLNAIDIVVVNCPAGLGDVGATTICYTRLIATGYSQLLISTRSYQRLWSSRARATRGYHLLTCGYGALQTRLPVHDVVKAFLLRPKTRSSGACHNKSAVEHQLNVVRDSMARLPLKVSSEIFLPCLSLLPTPGAHIPMLFLCYGRPSIIILRGQSSANEHEPFIVSGAAGVWNQGTAKQQHSSCARWLSASPKKSNSSTVAAPNCNTLSPRCFPGSLPDRSSSPVQEDAGVRKLRNDKTTTFLLRAGCRPSGRGGVN